MPLVKRADKINETGYAGKGLPSLPPPPPSRLLKRNQSKEIVGEQRIVTVRKTETRRSETLNRLKINTSVNIET